MSAEWRLHEAAAAWEALLETTGGEVTPEVEEMEKRILENTAQAAEQGAALVLSAKSRTAAIRAEVKRLQERIAYQSRCEEQGKRLLRLVHEQSGETTFDAGTCRVTVKAPPQKAVMYLEALTQEEIDGLVTRGLADVEVKTKVDKRAVLAELKKGAEVPGYTLERSSEKVVVVK